MVCGLTRVATIQAGSADGNVTDPVGPGYPHHNTSHGNQDIFAQCQQLVLDQVRCACCRRWTCPTRWTQGKTVLHNSLILVMSECLPVGHDSNGVPVHAAGQRAAAR